MTDVREMGWSTVGDDLTAAYAAIIVRDFRFGFREEVVNNRRISPFVFLLFIKPSPRFNDGLPEPAAFG